MVVETVVVGKVALVVGVGVGEVMISVVVEETDVVEVVG